MNWICTYYYCTSIERLSHYNVCCPVYNTKLVKITNTAFTEESVCKEIHMSSTTLDGNDIRNSGNWWRGLYQGCDVHWRSRESAH
jgi:hypothetical protein